MIMNKINILDEKVSSRIAAGEVIERPSSVVKELVENSIDARANAISIYIEEGGIKTIRVTDNGEGMGKEDVKTSILKHATSKIVSINDLNNIVTMGFRGEALPSIAAVSILTIKSKLKDEDLGTELVCRGGSNITLKEIGIPDGTSITVNNLFYNTPARLKFLKKTSTELGYIVDMVSRLILSHPDISFRLSTPEKTIYHSPGNGELRDAIYSVYGANIKNQLIPVDYRFNSIYLKGFIGAPSFPFRTTKHQTLLVNSRYVRNELVSRTVLNAYGERLMKNNFPFFVLDLSLNPSDIDVNVHPNKLAIHFRDESEIEYVISNAVDIALRKFQHAPYLKFNDVQQEERPKEYAPVQNSNYINENRYNSNSDYSGVVDVSKKVADSFTSDISEHNNKKTENYVPLATDTDISASKQITEPKTVHVKTNLEKEQLQVDLFKDHLQYRLIGVAFDTYIFIETGDNVYIIDQHAAHERKIYDILYSSVKEKAVSQQLLIPFDFDISYSEKELLLKNLDIINDMGFSFSSISDKTCELTAYPQVLGEIDVRQTLQDLIESLEDNKTSFEIRKDKIAKGACKRAIKGGMQMSDRDIRELLETIMTTKTIPHCPHGRPLAIQLTKDELEHNFGRIV